MTMSLDELREITQRLDQAEAKAALHQKQVVELKNTIKCICWHPRSGETLRKARELVARIEC